MCIQSSGSLPSTCLRCVCVVDAGHNTERTGEQNKRQRKQSGVKTRLASFKHVDENIPIALRPGEERQM